MECLYTEVEPVEVGREGEGADLLPGAGAGAADGVECKEVALTKTGVAQSTEMSGLEVGGKVAIVKMRFLAKAKMEFLPKGAFPASADLVQGEVVDQEIKRCRGAAQILKVHQTQGGAHKRGEGQTR